VAIQNCWKKINNVVIQSVDCTYTEVKDLSRLQEIPVQHTHSGVITDIKVDHKTTSAWKFLYSK